METIVPMSICASEVRLRALQEIRDEDFKNAVEAEKQLIRTQVTLWQRIFPWVITVKRRAQ